MMDKQFRVLIIDDHPMMRRGFGDCLIDTGRFLIAGEADSLEAGRAMLEHLKAPPDLIILDISLGDENGLDFIGMAKDLCAARKIRVPPVLIYSVFEDPFRVQTAMQLGARGYVSKSAGEPELLRAIDRALAGEWHLDEKLAVTVQKNEGLYDLFTRREREILMLVKQDYDTRLIAALCGITPRTVENHLSHIYYKTGLKNREQLRSL
jgi:NarL family two-component system response regulator LiaR